MSAVSMSSRKMPWQTKAERVSVLAALAIKREMVMQRLVRLREEEGHPDRPGRPLPVEEAAARAGVKYRTWQRWEAGDSVPYARNLSAIADAFGFDVAEFYDDSGDRAPTPDPFPGATIGGALAEVLQAIKDQLAEQTAVLNEIKDMLAQNAASADRIEEATRRVDAASHSLGDSVAHAGSVLRSGTRGQEPADPKRAPKRTRAA